MSEKHEEEKELIEKQEQQRKRAKTIRTGVPAKISIENVLKAIKVLSDKGSPCKPKELEGPYGVKSSTDKEFLSRSLALLSRYELLTKSGSKYSLSELGKDFIASDEEKKKRIFAEKFAAFKHYQDIFIRMKNEPDKSIKKEDITEMWTTITGGSRGIRERYTLSFSSIGHWSGVIEDTGRTCKLTPLGEKLIEGEEIEAVPGVKKPPGVPPPPSMRPVPTVVLETGICPYCSSTEIGIISEEPVHLLPAKNGHIAYVRYTFHCRSCKQQFSRHGQQFIKGTVGEALH